MNIKKYTASTEKQAIEQVKLDLGLDAVILNIKKIEPKGFKRFFVKSSVEVLAAVEEQDKNTDDNIPMQSENFTNLEKKLDRLENIMSEKLIQVEKSLKNDDNNIKYKNEVVELIYNHLKEKNVDDDLALMLIKGIESRDMNDVVTTIYKRIIKLLDEPEIIKPSSDQKVIIFVGTTGVGKTTTIAKVAAELLINQNKTIGLITTDTYRIAAVEQLKTYSKILNLPVEVAYSSTDLRESIQHFNDKDIVLIDTAGASQKNEDQFNDTIKMINTLSEMEIYLVISLTTKYEDMIDIVERYSYFGNIKIIFSKLDETNGIGSILNIKSKYGVKLSYITTGQNVPDDIEVVDPHHIAKLLLGGDFGA
ncbi:flagellar biosynthesis protein FlhF [Vallitalea okinawensis]|uniref:flagellar biosynthesis protein FlhF n=1 Tax=Vallitalea okinawensis TaxID=2078660 RepID=UPI000CFC62B1|nr:flagellar biosynthesis protein FlhF [Vallitalea okinawensis]